MKRKKLKEIILVLISLIGFIIGLGLIGGWVISAANVGKVEISIRYRLGNEILASIAGFLYDKYRFIPLLLGATLMILGLYKLIGYLRRA